jgi:sulfatase modifying factor 1
MGTRCPWGNDIDPSRANYDNHDGTTPIGSYAPNAYGLYDVAGNAWEWVSD